MNYHAELVLTKHLITYYHDSFTSVELARYYRIAYDEIMDHCKMTHLLLDLESTGHVQLAKVQGHPDGMTLWKIRKDNRS